MPFLNKVKCRDGNLGTTPCGLVVKVAGEAVAVPLVSVTATVDIINVAAEVTLEQKFINNSGNVVDAVYFFPTGGF